MLRRGNRLLGGGSEHALQLDLPWPPRTLGPKGRMFLTAESCLGGRSQDMCHSCSSHLSQCSGTVLPSSLPPLFLPLTVCLASEKKSCAISTLSKCKHECFISLCSQTQLRVHTNWRTKVGSECPGALWLSLYGQHLPSSSAALISLWDKGEAGDNQWQDFPLGSTRLG